MMHPVYPKWMLWWEVGFPTNWTTLVLYIEVSWFEKNLMDWYPGGVVRHSTTGRYNRESITGIGRESIKLSNSLPNQSLWGSSAQISLPLRPYRWIETLDHDLISPTTNTANVSLPMNCIWRYQEESGSSDVKFWARQWSVITTTLMKSLLNLYCSKQHIPVS